MAVQRVAVRRGDTFSANAVYTDDGGSRVNLTGYVIESQLRGRGRVYPLEAVITDAAQGEYSLYASAAATRQWDPGAYEADVQYTLGDVVSSTDSFFLDVVKDVTNAN
jgi:hypothetical protein